jgi:hypothetical protein
LNAREPRFAVVICPSPPRDRRCKNATLILNAMLILSGGKWAAPWHSWGRNAQEIALIG